MALRSLEVGSEHRVLERLVGSAGLGPRLVDARLAEQRDERRLGLPQIDPVVPTRPYEIDQLEVPIRARAARQLGRRERREVEGKVAQHESDLAGVDVVAPKRREDLGVEARTVGAAEREVLDHRHRRIGAAEHQIIRRHRVGVLRTGARREQEKCYDGKRRAGEPPYIR